jgi:hypothetical protein|tara:strand:+ start:5653 stop:5973 length:321 start_codon:yes stop_codon:yes gene_type:complete
MSNNENHSAVLDLGDGHVSVSTTYYENGHYVTICPHHGATTSGVEYITLDAGFRCASVHWNGVYYSYTDVDAFWALSVFAATQSVGKMANAIKAHGTLESRSEIAA